ncbi:hypothetical protein BDR06DRAFT_847781, partial [Suillus hirtellus]
SALEVSSYQYIASYKVASNSVYTRWMSGNDAWDMQSAIPKGATLLGTILSSDKTNITALMGDHIAHLLLISLSNIHMNV